MTFSEFGRRATDRGPQGTSLPRWARWLVVLAPLSAGLTCAWRAANGIETKAHADSVYVRRDSFAIHQASETASHLRDSLVLDAKLSRLDTSVSALVRACRRRGECP